jgi:single-strand DNA-binding protein
MMNQCTFIGNLGADPETRNFSNGGKVCNLRLAVSEKWKTKDGERKEKTEWISVAIFSDGLVRIAEQYLRKGSKVMVQGKFTTRKWQDQSGADRYSTEIVLQGFDAKLVMLDGPSGEGQRDTGGGYDRDPARQAPSGYGAGGSPMGGDMGEEIPFQREALA